LNRRGGGGRSFDLIDLIQDEWSESSGFEKTQRRVLYLTKSVCHHKIATISIVLDLIDSLVLGGLQLHFGCVHTAGSGILRL